MKYWRHAEEDARVQGTQYDKRRKLTEEQKEEIKAKGASYGIRKLSREYNVDKRLIQFILYPERLKAARANRDWTKYHDRVALTTATRELRKRKKLLIEQGKIVPHKNETQNHNR